MLVIYQIFKDNYSNMKTIKENEYFQVGETIFQYIIVEGKHKLIPTKKVVKKVFVPPTLDEVKKYFADEGYMEETAIRAFNHYDKGNWHNSQGKPVKNWRQTMYTNWMKPENKITIKTLTQQTEGIKFFQ